MNCYEFVLSKFRSQLIAATHLIIRERTDLTMNTKSSKFLLEIMTLVSSAINIVSDTKYSKPTVTQQ